MLMHSIHYCLHFANWNMHQTKDKSSSYRNTTGLKSTIPPRHVRMWYTGCPRIFCDGFLEVYCVANFQYFQISSYRVIAYGSEVVYANLGVYLRCSLNIVALNVKFSFMSNLSFILFKKMRMSEIKAMAYIQIWFWWQFLGEGLHTGPWEYSCNFFHRTSNFSALSAKSREGM